jgi:hypothetical protein
MDMAGSVLFRHRGGVIQSHFASITLTVAYGSPPLGLVKLWRGTNPLVEALDDSLTYHILRILAT